MYREYYERFSILETDSFFDTKSLHKWAREVSDIKKPYATINFDVLASKNADKQDISLFKEINDTLGFVEDYSIQVNAESLLILLQSDAMSEFKDELSNYYIWSESKTLQISTDIDSIMIALNTIYEIVKEKVFIRSLE
jgi:type III secretory pathway component EscR